MQLRRVLGPLEDERPSDERRRIFDIASRIFTRYMHMYMDMYREASFQTQTQRLAKSIQSSKFHKRDKDALFIITLYGMGHGHVQTFDFPRALRTAKRPLVFFIYIHTSHDTSGTVRTYTSPRTRGQGLSGSVMYAPSKAKGTPLGPTFPLTGLSCRGAT